MSPLLIFEKSKLPKFPLRWNKDMPTKLSKGSRYHFSKDFMFKKIVLAPTFWNRSCLGSECSLHQISPYIGKLKSSIAKYLVKTYSKPGELVVEPFSGSGTIPLEAIIQGRKVFASDISLYAEVLSKAKLSAPPTLNFALDELEDILEKAEKLPNPDLRKVPIWVKKFFHKKTLRESIKFAIVCRKRGNEFFLASFLGILHHQRPGFLSYPSSHLVPYLRDKKFPPKRYPKLYEYRELRPRLIAKIKRLYKRYPRIANSNWKFKRSSIKKLPFPRLFNCIITSPPYMNTLDYERDNRLRLWFINLNGEKSRNKPTIQNGIAFKNAIISLAKKVEEHLKFKGFCVLIVGELNNVRLSEIVHSTFSEYAPSLKLIKIIRDRIPDIRRARRYCKGTKIEHMLVFQKVSQ